VPLSLMWQLSPFSPVFRKGKLIMDIWELRQHVLECLGGLLGKVGTIPSSSLYPLPLPIPFIKLGLSMTMKSSTHFVGVRYSH